MKRFYRRKLPHWHPEASSIFLTWRLHGSLPKNFTFDSGDSESGKAFVRFDRVLDRTPDGPHWLRDSRIAQLVAEAIEFGDKSLRHYDLIAYVVMSNHVHVLLSPLADMPRITKSLKGTTARRANVILGHSGQAFWQRESFDHWPRNDFERRRIIGYIEANPVTAGLVAKEQDWPWSSASRWRRPEPAPNNHLSEPSRRL